MIVLFQTPYKEILHPSGDVLNPTTALPVHNFSLISSSNGNQFYQGNTDGNEDCVINVQGVIIYENPIDIN